MKKTIKRSELKRLVESVINETYHFNDKSPYTSSEYEDIDGNIYDVTDTVPNHKSWKEKYRDTHGSDWTDEDEDQLWNKEIPEELSNRIRQVQLKHSPMVSDNPKEWLKQKKVAQDFYDSEGMKNNDFYKAFDNMKKKYPSNESRRRMVNYITESVVSKLKGHKKINEMYDSELQMASNRLNAMNNGMTPQQSMQRYPEQQQNSANPNAQTNQQTNGTVMIGKKALINMANNFQNWSEFCKEMLNQ